MYNEAFLSRTFCSYCALPWSIYSYLMCRSHSSTNCNLLYVFSNNKVINKHTAALSALLHRTVQESMAKGSEWVRTGSYLMQIAKWRVA